ncbi:MAG: FAD-binding oxidoreductase [Jatrophihabitans sp.]
MATFDSLQLAVDGEVIVAGAEHYEWARKPFMARFDSIRPQAVVRCRSAGDVSETVAFARAHDIRLAVRSGGHCFAGHSSTDGIVIDVSPMCSIALDNGLVRTGSGLRLGVMNDVLFAHGLTIPAGSCPSVGIGGTALGGGLGVLGRKYGLTCDHLESAEIVLADGTVRTCDAGHDPDLFWALRGAGKGNFGVATSFAFRPRIAPDMVNFYLVWPMSDGVAVTDAWQRWAPFAPDDVAAGLAYSALPGDSPPVVELYGAIVGTAAEAEPLLAQFVAAAGVQPVESSIEQMTYQGTSQYQAELLAAANSQVDTGQVGPVERQGPRWTKSEFFEQLLPLSAIQALVAAFDHDRQPGQYRGLEWAPWGGAYNRVPVEATAFAHRQQLFSLKHALLLDFDATEQDQQRAADWVRRSWRSVHPWGSGRVYPNFPDPELVDWERSYYGEHVDKLRRIRSDYDPAGVFNFSQSIPTLAEAAR